MTENPGPSSAVDLILSQTLVGSLDWREPMLWFSLVFLVLLKIPVVYLGYVIWWAVKDPPGPGEGFADSGQAPAADGPEPGAPWWKQREARRPMRRGPHGSPTRRPEPVLDRIRSNAPTPS